MHHKIFIVLVAIVFLSVAFVFNFFPRSTFSELERRELATFPDFEMEKLKDGSFNKEVSSWYSDTEPYRDILMAVNLDLKDRIRLRSNLLKSGEEQIVFHATDDETPEVVDPDKGDHELKEFENKLTQDEKAKVANNRGVIVIGEAPNARALMAFGGSSKSGTRFAETCNKYKRVFDNVNVYCMVIPTSTDYYLPASARKASSPFLPTIKNVHANLKGGVKPVDVYTILGNHAQEAIFLRTDHHWAPLGAYYAAKKFAEVAGVPYKDISNYDTHVIHNYVGTMYGYSKNINVKRSPEDFVYHTPRGVKYTTTYITYQIDKDQNIRGESKPAKGEYFFKFKDGSPSAYLTFMGGDYKITKVETDAGTKRKVMIIKDSFGNCLPGYLFYSFDELHVVDMRYFNKDMKKYVRDNGITDILFAFNIFNVCSDKRAKILADMI